MRSLVRFNNSPELRRMQNEFDRLFEGFFPNTMVSNDGTTETAVWSPRVDLSESDDAYLLQFDVPGIDKKDIHIHFHDGTLTISGERKSHEKTEDENFIRIERNFGHFRRTFKLPQTIKIDAIEAKYKDGVLRVTVPKAEEVKPVSIKVS